MERWAIYLYTSANPIPADESAAGPILADEFPGAVEMPVPPSESILAAYRLQTVAADAASCSQIGK